jgi:hypothetical protein
MEITANLEKLIIKVSNSFEEKGVEFCIAGGWAVGIWSTPRATEDLDLLIVINKGEEHTITRYLGDSVRVVQTHKEPMKFNDVLIWRHVVSLTGSDDIFVLDMIIADKPFLKQAVKRRIWLEFRGEKLPIICIEDLILMKKISNRKQDQIDVENLLNSNRKIDWDYIKKNASKLGIKF